jgi:hypothetical protein
VVDGRTDGRLILTHPLVPSPTLSRNFIAVAF